MRIHKEGIKIIFIVTLLVLVINLLVSLFIDNIYIVIGFGLVTLTLFVLILRFFRNPERSVQPDESLVLSSADGEIVAIEETIEHEYFKEKRLQISVFMSVHNVHINRYPVSGVVKYVKYHEGHYLLARHPKSSLENERSTVVIETPAGTEILVRQIAGAVARRVITYAIEGQKVIQGTELGFIRFGSRVDIFLPVGTKINVQLGQQVKGNLTVIARF